MADNKAKRSQWYTFLNTGSEGSPAWVREGKFASELTAQMNPQTKTTQDVTQDTAETDITGYQPSIGISKSVSKTDPTFEFIDKIRRSRSILSDAYTQIRNERASEESADEYIDCLKTVFENSGIGADTILPALDSFKEYGIYGAKYATEAALGYAENVEIPLDFSVKVDTTDADKWLIDFQNKGNHLTIFPSVYATETMKLQ